MMRAATAPVHVRAVSVTSARATSGTGILRAPDAGREHGIAAARSGTRRARPVAGSDEFAGVRRSSLA
jgi:hypothetical protein